LTVVAYREPCVRVIMGAGLEAGIGNEPLGRRERKKLDMLQRIRAAAADLFREKGYDATTVEEIAERADVAKGTFFNYYPRKDALLEELGADMFASLVAEYGPVSGWPGDMRAGLLGVFLRLGELAGSDRELSKVMIVENMRTFWLRTEEAEVERAFRSILREAVEEGRNRGEFREDVDVDSAVRVVEGIYITTLVEWLRAGTPYEAYRSELTAKFDLLYGGLAVAGPGGRS
jgi:TetR/AcrR family transcriptional regulator, cholesterol catabolism regulator